MTIEPITDTNINAVWNLYQRSVAECDQLPLEWFRYKVLGDPDYSPVTCLVAIESGRPIAFMDAVLRTWEEGPTGWLKAWATDPDHRGRGLATELLSRAEAGFRSQGASAIKAGQAKPHYYTPGIDPQAYTPGIAFLLRRGFRNTGFSYNMDVPLDRTFLTPECVARMAEQGITARRVEKSEKDRAVAWVRDAGWGYSWQYQAGAAIDADPSAAFVAEKEGEIVGFAVYDAVRPGWFGPTGTMEIMRGTGIGSVLFLMCLDDMRERGYSTCHICAVGPLYFYAKVGNALVSRTFWHLAKTL